MKNQFLRVTRLEEPDERELREDLTLREEVELLRIFVLDMEEVERLLLFWVPEDQLLEVFWDCDALSRLITRLVFAFFDVPRVKDRGDLSDPARPEGSTYP